MKWQFSAIYLLFCILFCTTLTASDAEHARLICNNVMAMHHLWESSGYGNDPGRTERAAWIVIHEKGTYEFVLWPHSAARESETWRGAVPSAAIAIVHTHPNNVDPKPSTNDMKTSAMIHVLIYVISKDGIWSVDPRGHMKREENAGWYKKLSPHCD